MKTAMHEPALQSSHLIDGRAYGATVFALAASAINNVDTLIKIGQFVLILVTIGYTLQRWHRNRAEELRGRRKRHQAAIQREEDAD